MPRRIGAVVIHGMGSQAPGFSAEFVERVAKEIGDLRDRIAWQEVHWAYALKGNEDVLWRSMVSAVNPEGDRIPLDYAGIRRFVIHNFGDALAYHRDSSADSTYRRIHELVGTAVAALHAALGDPTAPVLVFAHSLGAHIMSNYLWDRQNEIDGDLPAIPTLLSFITFGCNIPLFSLAWNVVKPIELPGEQIRASGLRAHSKWLNFLDRDDVLGWPVRPLYEADLDALNERQRETVQRIEDREINVGGIATSWNPASHTSYDTDHDLIRPIAEHIEGIFRALDETNP